MKSLNYKKLFLSIAALGLSILMSACAGDEGGLRASQHAGQPDYDTYEACLYQQKHQTPVGIPGNPYCPYQGQTYGGQAEAYAQVNFQGRAEIDFGLQYNDACPAGQMPVYEYSYGRLQHTRCDDIGGGYTDYVFYQHHNSSNCAGGYAGDSRCIPM